MNNLAIIPARSGSKGITDKNIRKLYGKPLLCYSICAAKESNVFSEVMVSTDSNLYADIAISCGASVPFLRSMENSGDSSGSWDAVMEVLENYKKMGLMFDTVCLLQPTSPLRKAKDIERGYNLLLNKNADAITSVCEVDHSPLWTMELPEDGSLADYRNRSVELPRQQMGKFYRVNGAIYIRCLKYSITGIDILDENEYALIMDRINSVDIDTMEDFEYSEFLMNKYQAYHK